MRILMTGATGLIGSELGKRFVEQGHTLHVLTRNQASASVHLPFPARIFEWANMSELPPADCFNGVSAVVHLAGEPVAAGRWTQDSKARIYDSRIVSTRSLLQALAKYQSASVGDAKVVESFVLGSAVGIYGNAGEQELSEATDVRSLVGPKQDFLQHVVMDWEAELQSAVRDSDQLRKLRTCVLRTGVVLADNGGALQKMLPIFQMGLGGRLGAGQHFMSWIHLQDLVGMFFEATVNPNWNGVYNGTAPQPVRNREFTTALVEALGVSQGPAVPEFSLRLLYGEMADVVLGSQCALPTRALENGFRFHYSDVAQALQNVCRGLQGGTHVLRAEQWIPHAPKNVFPFFSDEMNLEKLTPSILDFKVLGKSTPSIQKGTLIDYRLGVHGIPVKWQTLIEEWQPDFRFVDTQIKGPYSLWHHTHEFEAFAGGTLMKDQVYFRLPMGRLGDLTAGWKVLSDVQSIFAYRRKVIGELFGTSRVQN